ncbi:MAG: hypothetical protein R2873_29435 [Caldilineaceae bacterium]
MAHALWVSWLFLAGDPVQFWVGKDYYVGALSLLRNGSANMDVLVAMGTTVAFAYSIAVLIADYAGQLLALRHHVYFETAAADHR